MEIDNKFRKKYISAIIIIAIFNALSGGLFLFAYFLSQNQVFLWGGLGVLVVTVIALILIFLKIIKSK